MSTSVIELYERLRRAPDDDARARIIAEAFEQLEDRYPKIKDLATAGGLRETELRLQKEIEQVRADLTREIEQVRADLSLDIERVRKEITQVRADLSVQMERMRYSLLRWIFTLLATQVFALIVLVLRTGGL
jgi:molecular chaperone GrpE (heat shock protein)